MIDSLYKKKSPRWGKCQFLSRLKSQVSLARYYEKTGKRCLFGSVFFLAFLTNAIKTERVVIKRVAESGGNFLLPSFDFHVHKFFNFAALQTNQMIVMLGLSEFVRGAFCIKVMTPQKTGNFKLGQYTIDRGQTHIFTFLFELRENLIGC